MCPLCSRSFSEERAASAPRPRRSKHDLDPAWKYIRRRCARYEVRICVGTRYGAPPRQRRRLGLYSTLLEATRARDKALAEMRRERAA